MRTPRPYGFRFRLAHDVAGRTAIAAVAISHGLESFVRFTDIAGLVHNVIDVLQDIFHGHIAKDVVCIAHFLILRGKFYFQA